MKLLNGKRIVLGVSGSVAAYKAANIASLLVKQGADVHVVMTQAAAAFISPLAFEALTKHHVIDDDSQASLLAAEKLATTADAVVIAPLSADAAAHCAAGIAEDPVCAVFAAACGSVPVVAAPAMNVHMFEAASTQENLAAMDRMGAALVQPASGLLACGEVGSGKLAPEPLIVEYVLQACACDHDLAGKKILVSAGPTQEAIDPVRYITNHSTGKMGYDIARMASLRGAEVVLVSGQVSLEPPHFVQVVPVVSAQDMFEAVMEHAPGCDAVIKAAAVADYKPATTYADKVKKKDGEMSIDLERTQDILAWLGAHRVAGQRLCGFSMETCNVLENSRAKLDRKNVDMICANSLREEGAGFGSATNHLTLISRNNMVDLPMLSKIEAANMLLTELFSLEVEGA